MDTLLFYTPGTCSLAPMVVLEWIDEPYRLCRVDRVARSTPEFAKVNPKRQVPAMQVEGRFLTENSALLLHLASRRPHLHLSAPDATPERDRLHQMLSYLGSSFHASFSPWFHPERYLEDPSQRSALKESARSRIAKEFATVDGWLAKSAFLMGENKTLADPYLHAMTRWGRNLFDLPGQFPAVHRHQMCMEEDPGIRFALELEKEGAGVLPRGAYRGHVDLEGVAG